VDENLHTAAARDRLLVIEDADDLREALKRLLQLTGYVVETASDGYAGVAAARSHPPAVAVVDIGLPGLDGWGVARALRREFGPRIRLIAFTSWGRPQDYTRSAEAGFDAHVEKPSVEDLIDTIRVLLSRTPETAT